VPPLVIFFVAFSPVHIMFWHDFRQEEGCHGHHVSKRSVVEVVLCLLNFITYKILRKKYIDLSSNIL